MTEPPNNLNHAKSRAFVLLEYFLLLLCLSVIAVRITFTEGLIAQSSSQTINFGDSLYSLTMSAVLIFAFVIWLVAMVFSGCFQYRSTAMEIGFGLFAAAAVIAGLAASNKRAAVTDIVCFLAPLLMAVMLVQILNSKSKIKLLLVCIAALGFLSAFECAEQFFGRDRMLIELYKESPEKVLEPLGIEPGSYQHMLLEHRLFSQSVRAFFTTANSAGSFFLLTAFAAIALFLEKFKNRRPPLSADRPLIASALASAAVLVSLLITRSKGAILSAFAITPLFVACIFFPDWLKKNKKTLIIIFLFLFLLGISIVAWYGITHDRLPGGNSMLVRWQYWRASAKMYADHRLTGVGPANFPYFYPRYKNPAALETVADPHSFPLSVLTQYGPLGLAGFLLVLFAPLFRIIYFPSTPLSPQPQPAKPDFKSLAIIFSIALSAVLLLVRPIILPMPFSFWLEKIFNILYMYVMPVVAFAIGFWLFACGGKNPSLDNTKIIIAALSCAILGVALHNLVDYAVFEPPIFTTLMGLLAAIVALDSCHNSRPVFVFKPPTWAKALVAASAVLILWAFLNYSFIPVARSTAKVKQAYSLASTGLFPQAHQSLLDAAHDDPLNPFIPSLNGRLYLKRFQTLDPDRTGLLLEAQNTFLTAIELNPADYRNFDRLTEVHTYLAQNPPTHDKNYWLSKALDSAASAVTRYPGSAKLRIRLAKTADQLKKTDIALENYQLAVDIEDSYRRQFQQMYPGVKVFSRLGKENYDLAKERVKQLSQKP